jgi:uncharacterized protein (DUF3084 family)
MTSGYIFIGAVLILGGIIAVSGDRIGTKVGKARLTLFKLRPRQTATLVTIITGTLISGSVLTLIFGASEQLRIGVFDLQKIQRKLSDTKENLDRALEQKDRVQRELEVARNAQTEAKDLLSGIDKSLKDELLKQSIATQNLKNTEQQLESVSTQRNDLVKEVTEISRKRGDLTAQQRVVAKHVRDLKDRVNDLDEQIDPLNQEMISVESKRSQLEQRLNTIAVEPNLVRQTQQLKTYENNVKKLDRKLGELTPKLTQIETQLKAKQSELLTVETQLKELNQEQAVRQAQLKEKDKQHQQLEREFQTRATQLKVRDRQLKQLENQIKTRGQGLASLETEVNSIEQEYRKIRQGNIGILRNQVLAARIVKAGNPAAYTEAIDLLLKQANLNALQATNPDDVARDRQIIELAPNQLAQLKQQISERRDYVVRIFSAENYAVGDKNVRVFADATPNQKLFDRNEQLDNVTIDPTQMTREEIRQQLNILLVRSQLHAKRVGILDDRPQIGDDRLTSYVQFLDRVKSQKYPIEIIIVVDRDTYTLGPLAIQLQAVANNKILFSTYSKAASNSITSDR